MIDIQHLAAFFPKEQQQDGTQILREYLQYVMLDILFSSPLGRRLTFLGGTCIRLVHGSRRFSEDLNFDNDGLTKEEFSSIKAIMERELGLRGFEVEVIIKGKTAYRCSIKYPRILHDYGSSGYKEEKLLIQIDTEAQNYFYTREFYLLNKFGVFCEVPITPKNTLLAQKFYAVLNRPRQKGRDYYDIVHLMGLNAKVDYAYLTQKAGISNGEELKYAILKKIQEVDIDFLAADVKGFLFDSKDEKIIRLFPQYMQQVEL